MPLATLTRSEVLIVGGGIVGLSSALAAAERGLSVVVVDEPRSGSASRAAAGMLAPLVEGLSHGVRAIGVEARDFYPQYLERLRERTEVSVPLDRNGIIELAGTRGEWDALQRRATDTSLAIDSASLARLEPALVGHSGALLHSHDGAVDNVALMGALNIAIEREPRVKRVTARVTAVDFRNDAAITSTSTGRHASSMVLLASGAWVQDPVPGLPRRIPVRPVRGQLLRLNQLPVRHVIYGGGGYLVPRGETLLIGATSENAGFDSVTTPEGREALLAIAKRTVPTLAGAAIIDHWAGLRPVSPDALPILGADPDEPKLVYACGFSRNGILLAPWAAWQLGPVFSRERPSESLGLFSVERFGVK